MNKIKITKGTRVVIINDDGKYIVILASHDCEYDNYLDAADAFEREYIHNLFEKPIHPFYDAKGTVWNAAYVFRLPKNDRAARLICFDVADGIVEE